MTSGRVKASEIDSEGLTPKQATFVSEYMLDLNATQAAIRAGYSAKTAKQAGTENLSKPAISSAIEARQRERLARTDVTADRVLQEIVSLAMVDATAFRQVKSLDDLAKLPEHVRRAVVGWKTAADGTFEVKLAKQAGLDMLAKHHTLYRERITIDTPMLAGLDAETVEAVRAHLAGLVAKRGR